jgi:hypothetical protein
LGNMTRDQWANCLMASANSCSNLPLTWVLTLSLTSRLPPAGGISVCHTWSWHKFVLVHYCITEHHCTVFLHLFVTAGSGLTTCFSWHCSTKHKCCMPLLSAD